MPRFATHDVGMSARHEPGTLGWWIEDRRGELGMTLQDVAKSAGISTEALRQAANGRPMQPKTKKGIQRALQWGPDYLERIHQGLEPIKIGTNSAPTQVPPDEEIPRLTDEELYKAYLTVKNIAGPNAAHAWLEHAAYIRATIPKTTN